ncbi:MAG: glycosyltransferase family 2 protein [Gemmatimonadaceae bacterium]
MTPRISIIIPLYNREALIDRALHSCLSQSMSDWEAIVVDDASKDHSRAVVERYADPRIKLVSHTVNLGQCVARNTGAAVARADWLLFLDSDDELTDGSLEVVMCRTREVSPAVGRLFFACRWDNGTTSPDPPFNGKQLNYEDFVRWLERMHGRPVEAISVVRRSAFGEVPYPNRRSHEGGHNLDFIRKFDFVGFPDVVRLYHLDAHNRMTDDVRRLDSILEAAPGHSWMADTVLEHHGEALQKWSPLTYQDYLRTGGLYHLLSGNRKRGIALTARAWLNQPTNLKSAALLACSWLPTRALAQVKMRWGN